MKILHVSNFGEKHVGRLFWNQAFKITNGLIRNDHSVYTFSDRDVSRKNFLNKINNNKNVNDDLISVFKNYNPDLVILGHADKINNKTLEIFRGLKKDIKIIEWNVDNYHLDDTEKKLIKRSPYLDGIFMTTADEIIASSVNNNFISFIPNIFDNSIERMKIFENKIYDNDIFFALSNGVGTGKLRIKNILRENSNPRIQFLNTIKNNLKFNVKFAFYGFNGISPIWASDFETEISKCHSSICLQRAPQFKYAISDRITQYIGNGLMAYINEDTYLHELFIDGKEAVFFRNEDDLILKINHYNKDTSKIRSIAHAGWAKAHNNYNGKVITKYMIDLTFSNKASSTWKQHIYR